MKNPFKGALGSLIITVQKRGTKQPNPKASIPSRQMSKGVVFCTKIDRCDEPTVKTQRRQIASAMRLLSGGVFPLIEEDSAEVVFEYDAPSIWGITIWRREKRKWAPFGGH